MVGYWISVRDMMTRIRQDQVFYDQSGGGVTFSGGEPLMQPAFLTDCLRECKRERIHTAIDTSGFCETSILMSVAPLVDQFLFDLKVMDDAKHMRYTGQSNAVILANLSALAACHPGVHVRIPLIPGVNDDTDNLCQSSEFLRDLQHIKSVTLLPYHCSGIGKYQSLSRAYLMDGTPSPALEDLNRAKQILASYGIEVGG